MAHPSQKRATAAREKGSGRPWSARLKIAYRLQGKDGDRSGGIQSGAYTENGLLNEIR
jgi:hypothetical protein